MNTGFEYVVSGAAKATQNRLAAVLNSLKLTEDSNLFDSENNHFFCSVTAAQTFFNKALKWWNSFRFYQPLSHYYYGPYNPDPLFQQKNHLMATQMIRYINHGNDCTWKKVKDL